MRNARIPALLAAIVHQPVLADVQVARPRPAPPVVRPPLHNRFLKLVELRVVGLLPVASSRSRPAPLPSFSGFSCPSPSWIIPIVDSNPSSSARLPITSASLGFLKPPPTTELMFTWNSAYSASICSFLSSTFRLFFETSSGSRLSIEICMWSRPAAFSRSIRSGVQQIAVGDHAGNGAGLPHAANNVVQVGMRQRLAARDADHGRSQPPQVVDAPQHLLQRHRLARPCRTRCSRRSSGCKSAPG